jgi:hypothetical protein
VCIENKISSQALLSHLKTNNLIQTRGKGYTKGKRIGGILVECVVLKLNEDDFDIDIDDLPFL